MKKYDLMNSVNARETKKYKKKKKKRYIFGDADVLALFEKVKQSAYIDDISAFEYEREMVFSPRCLYDRFAARCTLSTLVTQFHSRVHFVLAFLKPNSLVIHSFLNTHTTVDVFRIAKYGMSMCTLGWADEFKQDGIAVNSLWPKTSIATAAVQNVLGGDMAVKYSRTPEIMADAAYVLFTQPSRTFTGHFLIDEILLKASGVKDFSSYKVDPSVDDKFIIDDFFVN
ncbi:short-chain dehydrogenase/reductase SDR [Reticulomyxa filosa]|uniref:Short-chain dehydrogenase/reductase SDR n=1 Tax=Reticulomyxa filosa TaxID=46433 RepID=X6MPJ5_RETFI|nr:short-chain dehydrogenase/reductase SDR [Reticulomyxa filosa]|eukprot:ETO15893.1 short-chain dehydrogenase/reductase SDR [Reticulomyxa filosa]